MGYVLRRLRNDNGEPFKFPGTGLVMEPGDESNVIYSDDQAVPHGFTAVGEDVACDEDGNVLDAPKKGAGEAAALAGKDLEGPKVGESKSAPSSAKAGPIPPPAAPAGDAGTPAGK